MLTFRSLGIVILRRVGLLEVGLCISKFEMLSFLISSGYTK